MGCLQDGALANITKILFEAFGLSTVLHGAVVAFEPAENSVGSARLWIGLCVR